MNIKTGGGWGTREQAIPGEWATLILVMVIGAAAGFLVLWFTMLRHERTVLHRARRRTALQPGLVLGGSNGVGIGDGTDLTDTVDVTDVADEADMVDVAGTAPLAEVLGFGEDAETRDEPGARQKAQETHGAQGARDSQDAPSTDEDADEYHDDDDDPDPAADLGEPEHEHEPRRDPTLTTDPDEDATREPEPAPMCEAGRATTHPGAQGPQRRLTEEMLSRVEDEIAGRDAWHYKDLAALVHRGFGVTVHPGSIRRAVKCRRARGAGLIASAVPTGPTEALDPASA